MKTTMKKVAAWLLALLLVLQMVPAMAEEQKVVSGTQGPITSYRDKLDIIAVTSTITVGDTIQLATTDKYENISWKSDNEDIAKVDQTGKLKAEAPGQVKITASEGIYSDSITIRVVGKSSGEEGTGAGEKLVIIINGSKEKITYDGKEHKLSYTVFCSTEGFDENKLHLLSEDHLASGTECGVYTDGLTKDDFSYDGSEEVEFVITNGWLQIKPATISIYVNNAEKNEGDPDPAFTAEVTGLLGEDTVDSLNLTYSVSEDGVITPVLPEDGIINGHYRVDTKKSMAGKLTVIKVNKYPLYNIAKIGNDYYRLAKTTIITERTLPEYLKGITKVGNQYVMKASEYTVEDYNFEDLAIIKDGVEYVYRPNDFVPDKNNPVQYYTVKFDRVAAVYQKIGAVDKSGNPRWAVPEAERNDEENALDSIHRDYIITLHKMEVKDNQVAERDLYNMLSVNGSSDYYRLKKTKIKALPATNYANNRIMQPTEYERIPDADYDFTNVVLTIDGVDYQYSPVELTGEHPAYYTVSLEKVVTKNVINRNQAWFDNEDGWLDGSKATYGVIDNNIVGYHADYIATTHPSTMPEQTESEKSITLVSDWPSDKMGYVGLRITLTAQLTGFDGLTEGTDYRIQWSYTTDKQNWITVDGAEGTTFTFTLDDVTTYYTWRAEAVDLR